MRLHLLQDVVAVEPDAPMHEQRGVKHQVRTDSVDTNHAVALADAAAEPHDPPWEPRYNSIVEVNVYRYVVSI